MKPVSNWVRLSKALYFVYYGAGASLFPFLALYYQSLHLGGEQIGVLRAIPSLLMLLVAPIWAGLADATHRHKLILMLALSGTLAASALLSVMRSFWALAPVVVMYAVFSAPVMSLVDSSVVAMLQGERARYGRLRLWGAVGWGLVGPVVGVLVERYSLSWAFYGYYVMFGAALLIALRMPIHAGKLRTTFWRGFGELARNRGWLFFLGTMFLYTAGRAALETFLFLHLQSIGVTTSLMGLSLAVASVSELPVYFWSDRLLLRFGSRGLLIISMLSTAVMALAVGWMRAPWLILVIQLLHGPSFSAMWVAGVSYVAQIAPEGMGATAQGIFGSVSMGIGSAVASLLGGFLFARLGGSLMYTVNAGLVLASLGLFVWGARRMFVQAAHPAPAGAPAE